MFRSPVIRSYLIGFFILSLGILGEGVWAGQNSHGAEVAFPRGGGGLEFDGAADLTVQELNLVISAGGVSCRLTLKNNTPESIKPMIKFVVPEYPSVGLGSQLYWDKDIIAAREYNHDRMKSWTLDKSDPEKTPFTNFSIKVNGVPVSVREKTLALLSDKTEISQLLRENGISLHPDVACCRNLSGINFDRTECDERIKRLKNLNLVDAYGIPLWKKKTTFEWPQEIHPGEEVVVEYAYHPATGFTSLYFDDDLPPLESLAVGLLHAGSFLSGPCLGEKSGLDDNVLSWILRKFSQDLQEPEKNRGTYLYAVHYPFPRWKGLNIIKFFKLTVEHPEGGAVQVCALWPDMAFKRVSPTQVVVTKNSFLPKEPLSIVIASPSLVKNVF